METINKLQDLATHMDLEPAEEVKPGSMGRIAPCGLAVEEKPRRKRKKNEDLGVFHAAMPGGKTFPLLKTLLTSACERNCNYCPFRAGRNYRRATFSPDEMAKTFMDMRRAGLVEGLFLSSGMIGGGIRTQEKITDTAEILRLKYKFRGYIHLKIMPGSEKGQVVRAMRLANRLSVNLEAPNSSRLHTLAPLKNFEQELLQPLRWIEEIRHSQPAQEGWNGRWPSSTTQFVVGGGDESDLELLSTVHFLFRKLQLRRTYFSAFRPVPDTPLENLPAEDPLRQHRLYQASYLFRDYGFDLEELPFSQDGNLPRELDPKRAWAEQYLLHEPLEVNEAAPQELLRVPGVGPKSARTIIQARRQGTLRALPDLRKLGVRTAPMESYVLLDGKRPHRQLRLIP
jgi:predicted DNA-binding helix-hairpin-helix protein